MPLEETRKRGRKTSGITNKEIKQIESIFSPKGIQQERSRQAEKRKKLMGAFWEKHREEWRKLAPRDKTEQFSDFQKPVHQQTTAPRIIPRGGHPDEPMIDPDEARQKVIEQAEKPKKPEKKEPEKEPAPPKKRDKWETVRV